MASLHQRRASLFVLLGAGIALLVAGLVQLNWTDDAAFIAREERLENLFPTSFEGWISEDRALAATEAGVGQVEEILRFDEALLRTYRKGADEISVYVAYWGPGKISPREVSHHIPEVCWPAAGWKRRNHFNGYVCAADGLTMKPGLYRTFQHQTGAVQYVLYWHIYKAEVVVYNPDGGPSDWSMVTDLFTKGLSQRAEQYFVRVSSNRPLEDLAAEPVFKAIVGVLATFDLAAADSAKPST